jgi:deazaflavin-dependent oxidoreductase (nitroreductase family)
MDVGAEQREEACGQTVAGREIVLPLQVRDGDSWSAQFLVPAAAAQTLVEPSGLEVVRLLPGRAAAIVSFARYRDTDLGIYEEVAITFLVRRRGMRHQSGLYISHLAQTQPLPVACANELWGYPSVLAEIAIERLGGRVTCQLVHERRHVLTLELREGGPLRLTDPNLPNYGLRRGRLVESAWNQYGRVEARAGGAKITLGSHPISDELRALGLPKRALMSGTMRSLRAELGASRGEQHAEPRDRRAARLKMSPSTEARPMPLAERLKMRIEHAADTKGARVAAWLIRMARGRIGRLWGRRVLVLTTRGRRTGRQRTVPLQYFPDGHTFVVVAANSGLPAPPGWYFNLIAARRAIVDVEGRRLEVRAEELSDEEASAFWPTVLEVAPDYERYRTRTTRRIPLIRLIPAESCRRAPPDGNRCQLAGQAPGTHTV